MRILVSQNQPLPLHSDTLNKKTWQISAMPKRMKKSDEAPMDEAEPAVAYEATEAEIEAVSEVVEEDR